MKHFYLPVLLLASFITINAQDNNQNNSTNFNEVKLNALFMVVGAVDISYERLLNEESGIGLEIFLPFDKEIKDEISYYISPYYRLYFGKKYASGFFLEGFGMLSSVKVNEITFFDNQANITGQETEDETNFALGIGVGGKWHTKNGFIGELSLGVGRNLIRSEYDNDFVGKIGITVGYRF
jgi:hypothetical protein